MCPTRSIGKVLTALFACVSSDTGRLCQKMQGPTHLLPRCWQRTLMGMGSRTKSPQETMRAILSLTAKKVRLLYYASVSWQGHSVSDLTSSSLLHRSTVQCPYSVCQILISDVWSPTALACCHLPVIMTKVTFCQKWFCPKRKRKKQQLLAKNDLCQYLRKGKLSSFVLNILSNRQWMHISESVTVTW